MVGRETEKEEKTRPSSPVPVSKKKAALAVEKGGEMKPAGMGRGDGVWHGQQSRGDNILWITEGVRGKGELPEVCTVHT